MTIQTRVNKLRGQLTQLRKNYASAAASANKVVAKGLEKLADKELTAIRGHYEAALKGLKAANRKGNLRDVAQAQAKVLQSTLDRVMNSARDSVSIITQTSRELAKVLQNALKAAPARKSASGKRKAPAVRQSSGARRTTRKASSRR